MRQRDMLYKVPAVNQNQSIYRNSLAQRFKFVHSFQSLTFKHGFKADWFLFSFGFLHLTFTSDLIFPHWMSALAFLKYTSSSFTRQERNTGGFVLRCGGGWDSPPSLPESQLDVGRWDGKQVSPMTFGAQTLWASQPGVLHKLFHHSPSHPSPFILRQTCTNTHKHSRMCHQRLHPSPLMSIQDCVFSISTALQLQCISLVLPPWFQLNSERRPLRQRREHKVITSKSPRLAYVKPETIGKSAFEKAGCGSWQCQCPQHVCQCLSYRPLCFPHKKKINFADYQAPIKCLLLASNWEKPMPCPEANNRRSNRGKGHTIHFW